jgi:hypothetical protein
VKRLRQLTALHENREHQRMGDAIAPKPAQDRARAKEDGGEGGIRTRGFSPRTAEDLPANATLPCEHCLRIRFEPD